MKNNVFRHKILSIFIIMFFETPLLFSQNDQYTDRLKLKHFSFFTDSIGVKVSKTEALSYLYFKYDISEKLEFKYDTLFAKSGFKSNDLHEKYQQFYNGIKIENSDIRLHFKGDKLVSANGKLIPSINVSLQPRISEYEGLLSALRFLNEDRYLEEITTEALWFEKLNSDNLNIPKADLVIFLDDSEPLAKFKITYKFDIYAFNSDSREYIYIDAIKGNVVKQISKIAFAIGTGDTYYSGDQKTIITDQVGIFYRLYDNTRGNGIITRDCNESFKTNQAIDFYDSDNNWTKEEYNDLERDIAAIDAHWGSAMTYDYFYNVHGRNSFDNSGGVIINWVHYGNEFPNAGWTGYGFRFGDGQSSGHEYPMVSLDIIAHEFGHAFCDYSANLNYLIPESGALSEGLSDIWAACVEEYAAPEKDEWLVGNECDPNFDQARNLINPNETGNPDTYSGIYWDDAYPGCIPTINGYDCGAHKNSTVIGHWFYLLTAGDKGENDHGDIYDITGIGFGFSEIIVYLTEVAYLLDESTFEDFKDYTIAAAASLWGIASQQAVSVISAWYAVGVGDCSLYTYQNETIDNEITYSGCSIEVDNITVSNRGKLILDSSSETTIYNEFVVQSGAEFEIR